MSAPTTTDNQYFLPLSQETAQQLIQSPRALGDLTMPELAAVLLIQKLPSLARAGQTAPKIELALAEALKVGLSLDTEQGPKSFGQALAERFAPAMFQEGLNLLDSLAFNLLETDEVAAREYLRKRCTNQPSA